MKKRSGCSSARRSLSPGGLLQLSAEAAVAVMIVEQPGEAPAADREADVRLALRLDFGQAGAKRVSRLRTAGINLRLSSARRKAYHLTTFGCQMNEHDSERMKGMLESLGYREVGDARRRRSNPLQHLLDPGEGRQPARRPPRGGQAAEGTGPGARGRIGGCWSQSMKERVFESFRRRRGLRPGPGAQAGGVPDERQHHRAGLLRVRGLHGAPAHEARARVPGLGADIGGLQLRLQLLHSSLHAGARGVAAGGGGSARGGARRGGRGPGGDPARDRTSAPTGATCRRGPRPPSPSYSRWSMPSTGSSGSATRARIPRTSGRR